MSKILELYKHLFDEKHRFLDEVFETEVYQVACPKFTIVDLGAFEGEFGFYCYNFADVIYAVEPDPVPYANLIKNIETYQLDKIKPFNIAIDENGVERLFLATHFGGSAFSVTEGTNTIKVKTLSLKDFFKENNIEHVDILKIDVEGAEYPIFKAESFKDVAGMIDVIVGEDHRGDALKEILEPLGFTYKKESNCFIARR